MDLIISYLVILIITLFLSAFFSGSETALFSLRKSDLHRFSVSEDSKEQYLFKMMSAPERILITILSGNLFVNIIISAISTRLLLYLFGEYGHFVAIAVVTPLLIVFCEISPKVIATNSYLKFSKNIITLLKFFHKLFYPLRVLLLAIINSIIRFFSLSLEDDRKITEEELDIAIKLGEAEGLINEDEKTFINNVLRFSRKEAMNVMIPRNQALFIPYNTDIKEAMDIFLKTGAVRAPVYKGNPDNVVGMLDSRELIPYVMGYKNAKKINKLLYNIYHYPASKELGELLNDFLHKKIQIAIVVDEYGGTAGVVTLKSILSELMGREFIEFDDNRKDDDVKIEGEKYIISGDMQIDDFNYKFGDYLISTDSETVGGFIIEKLGYIPVKGEVLETGRNILTIRYMKRNRIESIELKMKDKARI